MTALAGRVGHLAQAVIVVQTADSVLQQNGVAVCFGIMSATVIASDAMDVNFSLI